jgi:uncharacterized membrane protein YGL010W
MKSIQTWLDDYSESHRNHTNKRIHWVCVPVILLTVFAGLRAIPVGDSMINAMTVLAALALAYYAALSWRLALGMLPVFVVFGLISEASFREFGPGPHLALTALVFVLAWIGQFVGHKIEGKKPSFFKDLQFLMIGPLWILADVFRRSGAPIDGGHRTVAG